MLARIAHELYWIGRQLSRAEHTARMLDSVFHADVQAQRSDPDEVRLSWEALLAIMGTEHAGEEAPTRDHVIWLLTLDPKHPASIRSCVSHAREGARVVRDVFSAEMWEAINTFHLELQHSDTGVARARPYSVYAYVKERCGLFWGVTGRTMLRDEAHAFLEAGASIEAADMVLRMLRVALPPVPGDKAEVYRRDGQARALLQAVGGFQAFRRAIPAPPNARPVARFLLYERAYPDSVASQIGVLHQALGAADPEAGGTAPVLRLGRLMADLEFRSRAGELEEEGAADTLGTVQRELAQVDEDIAQRYFSGATPPAARVTAY